MEISLSHAQKSELVQKLRVFSGETSGDIPVYSLHKIKNLIKKKEIEISTETEVLLIRNLIGANQEYRRETNNNWNCLTTNNLIQAIEWTDKQLTETINTAEEQSEEVKEKITAIINRLHEERKKCINTIRNWFVENYNDLLYDMKGKIPWPIIQRLQRDLSLWVTEATNPFEKKIKDVILEVAKEEGIYIEGMSAEDAWRDMGGTVFTEDK